MEKPAGTVSSQQLKLGFKLTPFEVLRAVKSTIVTYSDGTAGAARASYRLHNALLAQGIDSEMRVRLKKFSEKNIVGGTDLGAKAYTALRWRLGYAPLGLQATQNKNLHSANWLPSRWAPLLNRSDADVINLHWLGGETMSIEDIGRIVKPVVITMHDMWTFCGAEHYAPEGNQARWVVGYKKDNRPAEQSGVDINHWTWLRKKRAWRRPMHIVTPSSWLGDCARRSELLKNWPISVIPNPLDTSIYKPLNKNFSREILGLPQEKKLILFGAVGGANDPRKGYSHLLAALNILAQNASSVDYFGVIFGASSPGTSSPVPMPAKWMGHISDEITLSLLYNAADVMLVPSEQENLPQTATEALSCGCPVVGFDSTGMRDAVIHKITGYLAPPFEAEGLAAGIRYVCDSPSTRNALSAAARRRAEMEWSSNVVADKYYQLFRAASSSS